MGIKRYIATKDTGITNGYKSNLTTRMTGSNTGEADSVQIFHIYGQAASGSTELARALFEFPISSISTDRTNGVIPASGSVNFYLKLYNAVHPFTLPSNYDLVVVPLSRSFDEGRGTDCDEGSDLDYANWEKASSGSSGIVSWTTEGGDFHILPYTSGSTLPSYTSSFTIGNEDLNLDISSLCEEWIANVNGTATTNYGVCVKLSDEIEAALSSSYVKKFYARGTEYFFKRPCIEAQFDNSYKDNRVNFYASSSLASSAENTNNLFFYNYIRGQLRNVPGASGTGSKISLRIWTDPSSSAYDVTPLSISPITASWVSTGVYKASFEAALSASTIYDRWYDSTGVTCYHTGTAITVNTLNSSNYNPNPRYIVNITNLKPEYDEEDVARFRVFTREYDWNPNIYNIAIANPTVFIVDDLYYRVKRVVDDETVIEYGTGSANHTRLSYDMSGSYFDLDMELLEKDYMYQINFAYKKSSTDFVEIKDGFKFRVK